MDWTGEAIDLLRALWAEGHSTAEIGRRMGISKNAVVGKAHRLNLPPRPSPIRRDAAAQGPRPAQPRRSAAPARPPAPPMRRLEAGFGAAPLTSRPAAPLGAAVAPRLATAAAPLAAAASAGAVVRHFPRAAPRHCCWPMGEPGTAEFRFCGCDALPSKPYCAEHAAIAYVKVRDRREDAA